MCKPQDSVLAHLFQHACHFESVVFRDLELLLQLNASDRSLIVLLEPNLQARASGGSARTIDGTRQLNCHAQETARPHSPMGPITLLWGPFTENRREKDSR